MTTPHIIDECLLLYAANSGPRAAVVDSVKKLFGRSDCSLCRITHGVFGMRTAWRDCATSLGVPIAYYHLDDAPPSLRDMCADRWPCIVGRVGAECRILLDGTHFANATRDVPTLHTDLVQAAARLGWHFPDRKE